MQKPPDNSTAGVVLNTIKGIPNAAAGLAKKFLPGPVERLGSAIASVEQKSTKPLKESFRNQLIEAEAPATFTNPMTGETQPLGTDKYPIPAFVADATFAGVGGDLVHGLPHLTVPTKHLKAISGEGGYRTPEEATKLKADIAQNGIQQPVKILQKDNGTFEVIDGNKRIGIAAETGIKDVPVVVEKDMPDGKRVQLSGPEAKAAVEEFKQGPRTVSAADKLITEGKIRVVSRDGRDVYQTKRGGIWENARDEDSAVAKVSPKPVSEEVQNAKTNLEVIQDALHDHPGRGTGKFVNNLKGEFKKRGDAGYQSAVGQAESGGGDLTKLENDKVAYNALKEQEAAAKQAVRDLKLNPKPLKHSAEGRPLALNAREKAIALSRAEVRSLEEVAEAAREEAPLPPDVKAVSLKDIIDQTPVKKKVNLVDYLRTPDRVLQKIGLGPQAKQLRDAYDAYLKELPLNINRIRAWSKSVPKGAAERIFQYLDGQKVVLNPHEQAIAEEIRAWLKEWADRLGLPEDKRITNYITHIFDDQLLAKEFDEDLAKIITDKTPGEVYNPFLQARLGAKGYKQDVWQALEAYVKRGTRKANMDPVLEAIQSRVGSSLEFSNVEASQFKYIQRYIHGLNMRPTELDNLIDNTVKSVIGYRLGQRPLTRVTKFLRQMTYRALLGLNPGSALKNISQGINTYATLGEKYTAIGYAKLFNPSSIAELKREGVFEHGFIQDQTLSAVEKATEKIDKALFAFFETAERINRGAAYLGAKSQGLAKGMSEEEAIKYAKGIVRKTQFDFSPVDTPVAIQSDIVKTLAQFQNYSLKQTEFLLGMMKDKNFVGLMRYSVAGLAFVATIGQAFGMKLQDLLPSFRFDTPASLKLPAAIAGAALNTPDKYNQPRSLGKKLSDIGTAAIGLIPAGGQIKKTLEGAQAIDQGAVTNSKGTVEFPVGGSKLKDVQALLFGKYASPQAQGYFSKAPTQAEKMAQETYDEVQKLNNAGKVDEAQAIVDGLSDADYEAYKKIRAAAKAQATTDAEQKMLPQVKQIQQLVKDGKTDEAQKIVDGFTDEEYRIYKLAKTKVDSNDSAIAEGQNTPETFVGDVVTYAKALGTDPVTAFNRIFTGQKIIRLDNGTIIVERLPVEKSQAIKEQLGGTTEMTLDHIIPLELGGSNDISNLKLYPKAEAAAADKVENLLGAALRSKKITKAKAQSLMRDFKDGKITADDVKNSL